MLINFSNFKSNDNFCSFCKFPFNKERIPIRLLCGHHLCKNCIQVQPTDLRFRIIECPLCQTTTIMQIQDTGLHVNYQMLQNGVKQMVLSQLQKIKFESAQFVQGWMNKYFRVVEKYMDQQIKRINEIRLRYCKVLRQWLMDLVPQSLRKDSSQTDRLIIQNDFNKFRNTISSRDIMSLSTFDQALRQKKNQLLKGQLLLDLFLQIQPIVSSPPSKNQIDYDEIKETIKTIKSFKESSLAKNSNLQLSKSLQIGNNSMISRNSSQGSFAESSFGQFSLKKVDFMTAINKKYQLIDFRSKNKYQTKDISVESKIKKRNHSYNSLAEISLFSKKQRIKKLKDALKNVQYLGHTIQLIGYPLNDLDLAAFLQLLQWTDQVECLKLIKAQLSDSNFNTILNFLHKGVNLISLTVSNNNLTEQSLEMFLQFKRTKRSSITNLYLGSNFSGRGGSAYQQLRRQGLNVYC